MPEDINIARGTAIIPTCSIKKYNNSIEIIVAKMSDSPTALNLFAPIKDWWETILTPSINDHIANTKNSGFDSKLQTPQTDEIQCNVQNTPKQVKTFNT